VAQWRAPTPRRRSAASSEDWHSHLGRKVSIRYRLHDDPAHPFSEAIGVVQAVRDEAGVQQVEVLNRKGEVVIVPVTDVLAAKLFPID
jgi:ribosomal protein S12 methylthiotransferase accessory factor YcaO